MEAVGFLDAAVFTVVGGIIIFASLRRYQTWNTPKSRTALCINVGVFASFALGICIMRPATVAAFNATPEGCLLTLFSVPAGIVTLNLIQGEGSNGERLGAGLLYAIFPTILAMAILGPNDGDRYSAFIQCIMFMAMMVLAGAVHGALGPVISAVNLSMTIALLWDGAGIPNIATYFDVLAGMGVENDAFKVLFILASTILGLLEYLRNMPELIAAIVRSVSADGE